DKVGYVLGGSVARGTLSGSRGLPVEAALAAVGAVALATVTWREWRRAGAVTASGLVLVTGAAYFFGTVALLPVMWDRYLLPTVLIGALLSGLGVVAVARQVAGLGVPFTRRQPIGEGTALRA
ncbi:MAG: hypothetical protein M3O34_03210, partial [Chloroflexota bacterium]|nr:hypothetical protein [Chloroflexota bacterium]